jgi:hypothetical protein
MNHISGRMRGRHIYDMLFFLVSLCNLIECTQTLFRNCLLIQNLIPWGVLQFPGLNTSPSGQFDIVISLFFVHLFTLHCFLHVSLTSFYIQHTHRHTHTQIYIYIYLNPIIYIFPYYFVHFYDLMWYILCCNPLSIPVYKSFLFFCSMCIYFIFYHSSFNEITISSVLIYSMTIFMALLLRNLLMYQS